MCLKTLISRVPRRYFGAAKQLPGVRELFEKEAPRVVRRTRHQLYQHINADYYGFRDDEDGLLEKVEAAAEQQLRTQARPLRAVSFRAVIVGAEVLCSVLGPLVVCLPRPCWLAGHEQCRCRCLHSAMPLS